MNYVLIFLLFLLTSCASKNACMVPQDSIKLNKLKIKYEELVKEKNKLQEMVWGLSEQLDNCNYPNQNYDLSVDCYRTDRDGEMIRNKKAE